MTPMRALALLAGFLAALPSARAEDLLALEAKIPLGDVSGRIDHLAIDLKRQRLLVAELGNDTVGVVDLAAKRVLHRITGLKEPQGVAYVEASDLIFVANGDDGSLRWFKGSDFSPVGVLKLGGDADNIRVDRAANEIVVGYGRGALAVIDAATGRKKSEITLPAHPEGFQLAVGDARVFVNIPDGRQIAVVDRAQGRQIARWSIDARSNFPMALDEVGRRLLAVYRSPPTLAVFDIDRGSAIMTLRTCGDADDIFIDRRRSNVYVSCGDGTVAVIHQAGDNYRELARIKTNSGARTSLFVPEFDRLFVAVRERGREAAAIWVYRPQAPD